MAKISRQSAGDRSQQVEPKTGPTKPAKTARKDRSRRDVASTAPGTAITRASSTSLALGRNKPGAKELGFCCHAPRTLAKLEPKKRLSFHAVLLTLVQARARSIL